MRLQSAGRGRPCVCPLCNRKDNYILTTPVGQASRLSIIKKYKYIEFKSLNPNNQNGCSDFLFSD
jgi:hypothetical protein